MVYPTPGYVSETVWIFAATELSESPGEADEDEAIEVVRLPIAEIDAALPDLRDATTIIALLMLQRRLGGSGALTQ